MEKQEYKLHLMKQMQLTFTLTCSVVTDSWTVCKGVLTLADILNFRNARKKQKIRLYKYTNDTLTFRNITRENKKN